MPVLAEIVASPLLAGAAAIIGAHYDAVKPVDPCRPPILRLESADRGSLPGPNSPACKAAQEARVARKADGAEVQKDLRMEKNP